MTDVASVHESLVKLNQHTAARFDKTANTLIEVLDDQAPGRYGAYPTR